MRPILIAKTPRAGEFNHRYLVAASSDLDANEVIDWARRTTSRICGPDFFAVYQDVTQLRGGRTGEEGLMLIGIDTASLGEYQRVLLGQLQVLLPDLENLIMQEIDWQDYSDKGMVVSCVKLDTWMQNLEHAFKQKVGSSSGFPIYAPPKSDVDKNLNTQAANHNLPKNKLNKNFLFVAGAIILLLIFFSAYFFDKAQSESGNLKSSVQVVQKNDFEILSAEKESLEKENNDLIGVVHQLNQLKFDLEKRIVQCEQKINEGKENSAIKVDGENRNAGDEDASEKERLKEIEDYFCYNKKQVNDVSKLKKKLCKSLR